MIRSALALVVLAAGLSFSIADEKATTKKLEGTLTCTKCALGETDVCGHALKVKVDDKVVTYYLDDKGGKESYHKDVCTADKEATVEGTIEEKDGKKTIKMPKVTIKK